MLTHSGVTTFGLVLLLATAVRAEPLSAPARPVAETAAMPPDGPLRYVIEGFRLSGNTRTRASVILRYLPFSVGDVLDVDDPQIELTRYRLLGTGFFRDVTLSLEKGKHPGGITLHVEVEERNTIVVNDIWMGLAASADSGGEQSDISSFAGIDAAETNLLGTGISLGLTAAFSTDQHGFGLSFVDPAFLKTGWMLEGQLIRNQGLGFFGNSAVRWDDPTQTDAVRRQAVVSYLRRGATIGVGHDLGVSTQVWGHFRAERLTAHTPRATSHEYGGETEPLLFNILKGDSIQSTLRLSLLHDTRDKPILPSSGWVLNTSIEAGLRPILSDYAYQKIDVSVARHFPLSYGHVFSLFGFVGLIAGDAPFIEQYYVGDLSDFRPDRVLGLAFDDRPAPNILRTTVSETRYGDYAARVTGEYRIPIYRGNRSVYGIDVFVGGGLFAIASQRQLDRPPRNVSGLRLVPVDITASLGVTLDTSLGGFSLSVSNLVGFANLGQDPGESSSR
jgi:outer membrane protein insertion porin family